MLTIDTKQGYTEVETASAAEEAGVALAAHLAGHKDHPAVRGLGTLSDVGDQPPLLALSA